jgi:hypothetical protein
MTQWEIFRKPQTFELAFQIKAFQIDVWQPSQPSWMSGTIIFLSWSTPLPPFGELLWRTGWFGELLWRALAEIRLWQKTRKPQTFELAFQIKAFQIDGVWHHHLLILIHTSPKKNKQKKPLQQEQQE